MQNYLSTDNHSPVCVSYPQKSHEVQERLKAKCATYLLTIKIKNYERRIIKRIDKRD